MIPIRMPRTLLFVVAPVLLLAGCVLQTTPTTFAWPFGQRCYGWELDPVRTSWDEALAPIFARLVRAAAPDLPGQPPRLVIVRELKALARACGTREAPIIIVRAETLREAATLGVYRGQTWERTVAMILAHELAHATLHVAPITVPRTLSEEEGERQADELGIYYFHRAGWDCQWWVEEGGPMLGGVGRATRYEVWRACAAARRGQRVVERPPASP